MTTLESQLKTDKLREYYELGIVKREGKEHN